MKPKILVVDGMNMIHRARSGFAAGDWPVVYNFLRQFRALVELHSPTRVYVAMEGTPVRRRAMFGEYKANRKIDEADTKKVAEMQSFFKQVDVVRHILERFIPVSVVWHPTFEADDTIYNLIKRSSTAIPWVVASNDSDFTQLLDEFNHVKVYNPMKKEYVEKPTYNYVCWKALRGDGSDNIPRVASFTDASAKKLVEEQKDELNIIQWMTYHPDISTDHFSRNVNLIKFHTWSDEEAGRMLSSSPEKDWGILKLELNKLGFQSITNDKSWKKFVDTFDHMWG